MKANKFFFTQSPAFLVLENGSIFQGKSLGNTGVTIAECVFNTSLTGYQEILTDPSYDEQIITFTYPHIGNTGINSDDFESEQIYAKGLVIKSLSGIESNWRNEQSLASFLSEKGIIGIEAVDTRKLTKVLSTEGAQQAVIISGNQALNKLGIFSPADVEKQLEQIKALIKQDGQLLEGLDLAKEVTCNQAYDWQENLFSFDFENESQRLVNKFKDESIHDSADTPLIAVMDFGVKRNILRYLIGHKAQVRVFPAKATAAEILACKPDGILLSNGPGDPEPITYAIENIKLLIESKIPILGICLGHQLLSIALSAKTKKMKFGHHGANHPVQCLATGDVFITSQNHGFCVDEALLPETLEVSHKSLFDHTIQGIRHKSLPVIGFQGHPEASPGPKEFGQVFNTFFKMIHQAHS